MKLVIGARASNLAQIQANIVKNLLEKECSNLEIELKNYSTKGDQRLDINWKTSNESLKGLFTSELEEALLNNEIDIAVHSLKDMPVEFHNNLEISAYVDFQDERDVLVSAKYDGLNKLPKNAVVGTSSSRREMQLRELRSDLDIKVIRGNIETRINKMLRGEYDAIILAAAGLKRLNYTEYIKEYFNDEKMISASGQGILCLETRKSDQEIYELVKKIEDENTAIKASVERMFSKIFDGGCTTPMGCNAKIVDDRILFKGMYFNNNIRYDGYVEGYLYEKEAIAYRLANQIKKQYTKIKGKVTLVGAGPGSVDLLTIKAYQTIQMADCILYDRLIGNEILSLANKDCELIYVGKESHEKGLSQAIINEQMIMASFNYKNIVRLKSGDPFIFGRGYEEIQALAQYDIECEVIPGISSFSAASTYSNIPLTHRFKSSSIHIFSGHGKNNIDNLNYKDIAKLDGTIVFYMAIKNIRNIANNLIAQGMSKDTAIAFIENASTIDQRTIIATLNDVVETDISLKVKAPAIILIGDVVDLRNKGLWKSLDNKVTLLSTRENKYFDSFEKQANEYGFASLSAPQIQIIPCEKDESINVDEYDLILFNSANGVRHFANNYDSKDLKDKIIGSVGLKTTMELNKLGCKIAIMPKVYNMQELLYESVKQYPDQSILVVASQQTKLDLAVWQRRLTNKIALLVCYKTNAIKTDYYNLKEQINNSNVLCFFSSSGVEAFVENIKYEFELLDSKKIASIGPFTSKTIEKYGLNVDIEASVSTQEGLLNEIKEFYDV